MSLTFLIDECLSPELASVAHEAGYGATSLRDRGWLGLKDYEVVAKALKHDLVLVTRNAEDFRGSSASGRGGLLRREGVHPGLVCIESSREPFDVSTQRRLFELGIDELGENPELVNQALEVREDDEGGVQVTRYAIP